jgi:hypothetical protein
MHVIKNQEKYLHQDATMLDPEWTEDRGMAMRIRHILGARAIQEKTGGDIFFVSRDGSELLIEEVAFPQKFEIRNEVELDLMIEIVSILAKSSGFKINVEEVKGFVLRGCWSNANPRLQVWLNLATQIINKTEEVLNRS